MLSAGTVGDYALNGGSGNDVLSSHLFIGGGSCRLNGGAGADTLKYFPGEVDEASKVIFDYSLASDSPAGTGRDIIVGFRGGATALGNQIDLKDIDANTLVSGNQAFTWGGSFTAGHLRYVGGVLQGNTDGDAAAEFEIQLVGAPTLTVGGAGTDILL